MGAYTSRTLTENEVSTIISTIKNGYTSSSTGKEHRGNLQIATILTLQANLGLRIGDILKLTLESIVKDGNLYRLDITEEKTDKKRTYIVPNEVFDFINDYCNENKIKACRRIFQLTERAVQKSLKEVAEHLGFAEVSTHSFRKFCASRVYENSGCDIETVREFLQHSSVRITQRYIKRSRPQLESAILSSVCLI